MDSSQTNRISSLPIEVLKTIFKNVRENNDLNVLCRVSKLFHKLATPLLYEHLEIVCPEGLNPRSDVLKSFSAMAPHIESFSNLKCVRHLALVADFQNLTCRGFRCWHQRIHEKEGKEIIDDSDQTKKCTRRCRHGNVVRGVSWEECGFRSWSPGRVCVCEQRNGKPTNDRSKETDFCEDHFQDFCMELSENSLRSFRWELGTCVPQNILGKDGYLPRYQTQIERLSLITDGDCDINMRFADSYDLAKFDQIRDFSWVGLRSKADFEAMIACFITNTKHLEVLKLESFDWLQSFNRYNGFTNDAENNFQFFAQEILGYRTKGRSTDRSISLSSLQKLHLGQFYLCETPDDFASAFNMFKLKRLTLWNCLGVGALLEHLATQEIPLTSLEIMCKSCNEDHESLETALPQFLRKHVGLQDLFLHLGVLDWEDIIDSIYMQLKTIKRIVLHAQGTNWELDDYYKQEEDQALEIRNSIYDLFTNRVCEIIAISNSPHVVRESLEPHSEVVSCKLLHLRASEFCLKRKNSHSHVPRDEINNFADWAFGPKGFPELLVFAYGDFAFEKSCQSYNVLYCRNDSVGKDEVHSHYKVLTPDNKELWDWVMANMDALSCCPYRSLLKW